MSALGAWIVISSEPLSFAAGGDGDVTLTDNGNGWDIAVEGESAGSVGTIDDAEVYIETHND